MPHFTRDQLTYAFDPTIPPVATLRPGETLTVETYDTSTGRIHKPEDVAEFIRVRDPKKVNPACGPFYVEGAEPGDALAVEILDIQLAPLGWVRVLGGAGVITDGLTENGIVMVRVEGDDLVFGEKLRFRARPMVGVIGTAPAAGTVYTAHPGPQGSNMDYTAVAAGARVYLPVHVPGALLAIGDVHASMGDGEVSGTGVEINGEVTVRVEVIKGAAPARPWIETPEAWIATGQGVTLDDAVGEAVEGLTRMLMERFDLDRTEAFLLVSARGDVRAGQCARIKGCDHTAFAVFPKDVERLP
jgi:amidase